MMMNKYLYSIAFLTCCLFFITSCNEEVYIPKPKGYFRISLPDTKYNNLDKNCPFTFEISENAHVEPDKHNPDNNCWFTIVYPQLKASIYFSYKPIINSLDTFIEDSRTLAFKHAIKAANIEQHPVLYPEKRVFGIIYDISGNTASSYQFHLTDSTNHFLRGSLYFNTIPNQDSIQPVLNYVKKDIQHLFETINWVEN